MHDIRTCSTNIYYWCTSEPLYLDGRLFFASLLFELFSGVCGISRTTFAGMLHRPTYGTSADSLTIPRKFTFFF